MEIKNQRSPKSLPTHTQASLLWEKDRTCPVGGGGGIENTFSFCAFSVSRAKTKENTFECRVLDRESDSVLEILQSASALVSKESSSSPLGSPVLEEL